MNRNAFAFGVLLLTAIIASAAETTKPSDPDADLRLLKTVDDLRSKHDNAWVTAVTQLGALNSQRTFDVLAARLKADSMYDRQEAIWIIRAFNRPETVTLLAGMVENDDSTQVQTNAAEALIEFKDRRAEPALLKALGDNDEWLAVQAANTLGAMNSQAGLAPTIRLMEHATSEEDRELAIYAVTRYHKKPAVAATLKEYEWLLSNPREGAWQMRLLADTLAGLSRYAAITVNELGPKPDTLEQWQDWWEHAAPLLDDDLKLKEAEKNKREYKEADFGRTPELITLKASVDEKEFRIGDPIRLDLEMDNPTKSPYSLVSPRMFAGWTMGFGIHLMRRAQVLVDLAPTDMYEGSYAGPPAFKALGPGEVFRSSVCLQRFMWPCPDMPMAEGDYELTIIFDSAKFAGMQPKGVQMTHRWEAKPVKFTIKGEARKDPVEILHLIGRKAQQPWFLDDLKSPQPERSQRAWRALYDYGDSRIQSLVEGIAMERPGAGE